MFIAKVKACKKITWRVALALTLALPTAVSAAPLTIDKLLEAASRHPAVEMSELAAKEGELRVGQAGAALYPKLSIFAKGESYNSPTNLRPMPPTEVNVAAGDSLPFSREILRYGLSLEAPLYVGKVYRLREKMRFLAKKSAIAHQINLISRQAAVLSLASGYQALSQLEDAVRARLKSLATTRDTVHLKVQNGRTPEAELLKIDNSVIALKEQENDLAVKRIDIRRDLEKFTGLEVADPVKLELTGATDSGELIGLKLEEAELGAQKKELERARAGRYPTLSLYGTVSGNDGTAYNTDEHISRDYNFVGLMIKMPLYDRSVGADIDLARIGEEKEEKKLAKTRIELTALEKNLKARLPVVGESMSLAQQAEANNRELLKIARLSYEGGRTTTEEYLRYEAQLLDSQAALARARDEKWQICAKQAVLYGIDLRGVVK